MSEEIKILKFDKVPDDVNHGTIMYAKNGKKIFTWHDGENICEAPSD